MNTPNSESGSSGMKPTRREPNLELCRAKPAGFGDYVDCLTTNPHICRHSLAFGEGHLCLHPTRTQIVGRTKNGPGAAA